MSLTRRTFLAAVTVGAALPRLPADPIVDLPQEMSPCPPSAFARLCVERGATLTPAQVRALFDRCERG